MGKLFTKLILISVILNLFISSCGLLKKRTSEVAINKNTTRTELVVKTDSVKKTIIKERVAVTSVNDYDNEITIETDTGIIKIDPARGFIGKAKSVHIKSKGQLKNTDSTKKETAIDEAAKRIETKKEEVKNYVKIKDVKSEINYITLIICAIVAAVALFLFIKFHNFNS